MNKTDILQIARELIKSLEKEDFQAFCDRLLLKLYPDDYSPVRSGGPCGDMKNDGYCYQSRKFFQAHASRGDKIARIKKKFESDLQGCLSKQRDVIEFIYITNDILVGEVTHFVDALRQQLKDVKISIWGPDKISSLMQPLSMEDISFITEINFCNETHHSLEENNTIDLGIIGEIFQYIAHGLKKTDFRTAKNATPQEKLIKLSKKIRINFGDSQQKLMRESFTLNWEKKSLLNSLSKHKWKWMSPACTHCSL